MFWNDPTLYGATLPFKDIPGKDPFFGPPPAPWMNVPWTNTPWMNVPRAVPPAYGFFPPTMPLRPNPLFNYLPQTFTPFNDPTAYLPYAPPTAFHPYTLPYGVTPAIYNFYRPFPF